MHAISPFTFYSARIPALSVRLPQKFSHDDSLLSFPQSLRAADCWLLLPFAATRLFLPSPQNKTHTTQRWWFCGLLLPLCVRWRACVFLCARCSSGACRSVSAVCYTRLERLLSVATLLTFGRWRHLIPSFTTSLVRRALRLCRQKARALFRQTCATELGESHHWPRAQIPPLVLAGSATPPLSSRCTQQGYDGERLHKASPPHTFCRRGCENIFISAFTYSPRSCKMGQVVGGS